MIDVVKTLKPENMIPQYVEQSEYAVLEGVPWQQIEGWYSASALTPDHIEKLKNGEKLEELFEPNPEFDPKYLNMRSSGAQHQLAGFGKRKTGIPKPGLPKKSLRKIPPFDKFDHDKLEPYYKKTLDEVAPDLKLPNICKRGGSGCVELIREEQSVDIIEANNIAEATTAMEATEAAGALGGFEPAEALEVKAMEAAEILELEAEAAFFEEILALALLLLISKYMYRVTSLSDLSTKCLDGDVTPGTQYKHFFQGRLIPSSFESLARCQLSLGAFRYN
ncbi:uncharacterized protein BBA_03926 [Beauveria bassiana ARSEF 2860]|uniref:Uncharacterized protein n=1 Tax=Beauveria bassiana (strain ARSEF 2860) TaxID=655819 RepID=J4UQ01_BEAB2|nr:uncharacterized protein BBA_03926 [Beauveria bassiana ARSEF 2860]EJP67352.1 hypothetical protein BBA_03926 [Beauveria bassiana ARSEF 2860]